MKLDGATGNRDGSLTAPAAKWGPGGEWHPLVCHSLDVLAVSASLWIDVLSPATRGWVADDLGLDVDSAGRWVAALAGLHDLGKASPAFQYGTLATAADVHVSLARAGLRLEGSPVMARHGAITAYALRDALRPRVTSRHIAQALAQIAGGHHGIFPGADALALLGPGATGGSAWESARRSLVAFMLGTAGIADDDPGPTAVPSRAAMLIAGLIAVSDWIGSNADYFAYAVSASIAPHAAIDLETYTAHARRQAAAALRGLGWLASPRAAAPVSFAELFDRSPRPLQVATQELARGLTSPGIAVIEAPMGEGKTEAAIHLADEWGRVIGCRGAYVALPTQATSDQMFGRVRTALERRFPNEPVALQLLHGHASLNAEFELLLRAGERRFTPSVIEADGGTGDDGSVVAGAWFTARKRGLLASYGVGTVDQLLLGALVVKHVFVRLFGLAGRVVVIDEVHAYDTYMSTLLERLVCWLGALGSPVILLSATLPAVKRAELLAAYAEGAGFAIPGGQQAAYPRLTWVSPDTSGSVAVEASAASRRTLQIRWIVPDAEGRLTDSFLDTIAEHVERGGCIAIVCNTVSRAQDVAARLRVRLPGAADDGHPIVDLLHSRFPQRDRVIRESRVLRRFGAGDQSRRPDRAVLVATQIVEQSLDIDFDAMVTDFVPVDLLLQRSGRLHRHREHDATRPDYAAVPIVRVVGPARWDGDLPGFDRGTEAVYEDGHVRLRTWLALRNRESVEIPADLDGLIASVYDDADQPSGGPGSMREAWESTRREAIRRREADELEARDRWVPSPADAGATVAELTRNATGDDPDAGTFRAMTRLDADSVQVVWLGPGATLGGVPVDLDTRPSQEDARNLLAGSMRLSGRDVTRALRSLEEPPGWRRSPLLRGVRVIVADEDGEYRLRDEAREIVLRLDPQLGLVIDRLRAGGRTE